MRDWTDAFADFIENLGQTKSSGKMKNGAIYIKQLQQVFDMFYKNVVVKEVEYNYHVWAADVVLDVEGDPVWRFYRDKFGNWMGTDEHGNEHHFHTSYWHDFMKKIFAVLSEGFMTQLLEEQLEAETYE